MNADGFSSEFLAALRLLGSAMEEVAAAGFPRPILVGGAALQLWTTGLYVSGDFDLLAVDPAPMEAALIARGFRREDRRGRLLRGLYHPGLTMGVEFISGQLFDGLADVTRLRLVVVGPEARVTVIPVEDVIADRLGQYQAHPAGSRALLDQAGLAWSLASDIDRAYLDRRIRAETAGTMDLRLFEGMAARADNHDRRD